MISSATNATATPARRRKFFQKSAVPFACVLAALSGMACLAHQMIWTRRLVDLLGASSFTFSKVVGAFFLGLAAGSAVAAFRSGKVRHPWRWVAGAEFFVAALALPACLIPQLAEVLYRSPHLAAWLKFLVPFAFVSLPATAMGLVIPWMVRALGLAAAETKRSTVWLYATNTLGGVAGIVFVLFFALPALGLTGAGLAACGLNIVVAIAALGLDFTAENVPAAEQKIEAETFSDLKPFIADLRLPHLLAFGSGFLVLSLEVVLQHQFAQVTINSFFSNGTVLAWGLLSLAAGSALTPWLAKFFARENLLRGVLLAAAAGCLIQPFIFTSLRHGVEILPYELLPGPYAWEVGKLALATLCPVFLISGLLFPLLLQEGGTDSSTSRRVAILLLWNGLGGWCGSELSQLLITPHFGLWQSLVVLGLGYALLALAIPQEKKARRWLPLPVGVALMIAFVVAGTLPQVSLNPGERLAALTVGREGVVATVECAPGDWRMLFNNSYTLGGSRARANQEREAHLPILLHGHARSVGILGVASGGTVAGATLHPDLERIDAAELSPLVLQQAGEFFKPYSRGVFEDPRVHLLSEDARWMVATQSKAYDVIIGDLFLPWRTGEGRLFSVEHFQAVRRALKTDGVFCQWLPMFQLTRAQFDTIARSFQQVFPDALVVRGDFYTEMPILGLVGGRSLTNLDWNQIAEGCSQLRANVTVVDPLVRHVEGVAMMIVGALPAPGAGPVNTLANAWLEWDCGRNIVGMRAPWFVGVPEAEFVQTAERAAQELMPPQLQAAHDAGQFFLTLEIAAKMHLPQFENFAAQVPQRLPAALIRDEGVSWQEWPTRVKPRVERRAKPMALSRVSTP